MFTLMTKGLVGASAAESSSTTDALSQLFDFYNIGSSNALQDELRNAVAFLDLEIGFVVVEKQHLDLTTVIGVNDASAGVDKVLGSKARARSDATVCQAISCCLPKRATSYSGILNLHVPTGTAMLMSVSTRTLPRAGTVVSFAA